MSAVARTAYPVVDGKVVKEGCTPTTFSQPPHLQSAVGSNSMSQPGVTTHDDYVSEAANTSLCDLKSTKMSEKYEVLYDWKPEVSVMLRFLPKYIV